MKPPALVIRAATIDGENLRVWRPADPARFSTHARLAIGERRGTGSDDFSLRIATPAGLADLEPRDGILATRPLLVMAHYDFDALWRWLEHTVASCARETWPASAEALARHFAWEYDGYRER